MKVAKACDYNLRQAEVAFDEDDDDLWLYV